jgi:UDP-glucose 4-epimerase
VNHVLVAGAAGFLGRHVCRVFAERGDDVIAIGRGALTVEERATSGISLWIPGNISRDTLEAIPSVPRVIVNCTGSGDSGRARRDPALDIVEGVSTTTALLDFARTRAANAAFIHVSSGAVFGIPDNFPIPDSAHRAPSSAYGRHKALSELLVEEFASEFGVRSTIVRVFSVIGPFQRRQLLWDAAKKARKRAYVFTGTGRETRDWVAARDVAALMPIAAGLADTPAVKINCATGVETTLHATLEHLAFALGEDLKPVFNGVVSPQSPTRYCGASDIALSAGWTPSQTWQEAVTEFAAWFNETEPPEARHESPDRRSSVYMRSASLGEVGDRID